MRTKHSPTSVNRDGDLVPSSPISRNSIGALSYKPGSAERLVAQTLNFILTQLPRWRDDPKRPKQVNEKQYNSSLCDLLDSCSRVEFPMVRFKHEAPQAQVQTVDVGVHGTDDITKVGTRNYTIYEPFLVIEAKRLPSPSKAREMEYVVGTDKPTGGIQRFRLGLHGADVETAVMVGYVEQQSLRDWQTTINGWIIDLGSRHVVGNCVWSKADILQELTVNDQQLTSSSESNHQRAAGCFSPSIKLHHFWVVVH
jgi:hypothetical protein